MLCQTLLTYVTKNWDLEDAEVVAFGILILSYDN